MPGVFEVKDSGGFVVPVSAEFIVDNLAVEHPLRAQAQAWLDEQDAKRKAAWDATPWHHKVRVRAALRRLQLRGDLGYLLRRIASRFDGLSEYGNDDY